MTLDEHRDHVLKLAESMAHLNLAKVMAERAWGEAVAQAKYNIAVNDTITFKGTWDKVYRLKVVVISMFDDEGRSPYYLAVTGYEVDESGNSLGRIITMPTYAFDSVRKVWI